MAQNFIDTYLSGIQQIAALIDKSQIDKLIDLLVLTRNKGGRLFILGVGGGAGNAAHAVNDFRKICGIETYAPTDNVSELTARTNDEGWPSVFSGWLKVSRLSSQDAVLVFSVGGGDREKNISTNLVEALELAKSAGAKIGGIVGPNGGYTAQVADACVKVPVENFELLTPYTESFQAVLWHLLVSDPRLKINQTKWESLGVK